MRTFYVALVVAVLPSSAAAQSLCNPCVDPSMGSPRSPGAIYENGGGISAPRITAEDLQGLGLTTAADMLSQLPTSVRVEGAGSFRVGETIARLRSEPNRTPPGSFQPLVHETTVAAPLENVWRAWTTSAGLSAWLAPLAEIDLRIGGELRVAYDGAAGLDSGTAIVNEILAYDPPRLLAFRVARAPSNFPYVEAVAAMWTMVYLDPVSADATRVRVVVNGLGDDDARAFFESGNAETLRRLEERFGTPQ